MPFHPGLTILATFACVLQASGSEDSYEPCFADRPGTADRSDISLSVVKRTWLTHDILSEMTEIVLREFLGYSVTRDSRGGGGDWAVDMFDGVFDVDMENWQAGETTASYREYISGGSKVVLDAGAIGFAGRSGLYVFSDMLNTVPLSDYYKFFQNATRASEAGFRTFAETELQSLIGDVFPVCNVEEYSWCGTGQFEGYWAPPQCREDPGSCLEIFTAVPGYDTSYFEQLVKNHGVQAIFGYYGWGLPGFVQATRGTGRVPVFYWYQPDPLLLSVDAVRISFPDNYYGCSRDNNRDANTGPVECDYGETLMKKLFRRAVLDVAPEAYFFVSHFQIFQEQIREVMLRTQAAGGPFDARGAACEFVRVNVEAFRAFAPSCITNPPVLVQDGDSVFNPETLACETATVFYTLPNTYCFGTRPGTADRSDRRIKLVRRTWITHDIISILAESVLRDYLGFDVELIYNNRSGTSEWGHEMAAGLYDIDIEQWQVSVGTADYNTYIGTDRVVIAGATGFSGRSGVFVASTVVNRVAMSDYYKYYVNGSVAAAEAGFTTFANSPLRTATGNAFPVCSSLQYSWCSTGTFEGYYAPPLCQQNPSDCVEFQHIQPGWDSGYLEQLVKNLGLRVFIGYYGYGVSADLLLNYYDHTSRSVPFYWWEPDAFIVQVDAKRISFPDTFYGCDAGNTRSPETGTVVCDFRETTTMKIVTPRVRDEMQEAFYSLSRIQVFRDEIDILLSQHEAAGGSLTTAEVACQFITDNEAKMLEWVPSCLATPTPVEDVRVNDTVFSPQAMDCLPVTCASNEVLRFAEVLRSFYCDPCPDGQVPDATRTDCELCPLGEQPDQSGAVCQTCQPGSIKAVGEPFCHLCEEGRFMADRGQSVCRSCGDGFYQDLKGETACLSCASTVAGGITGGFGATTELQCICREGAFLPLGGSACVPCPEGMNCLEGADMRNLPGAGSNFTASPYSTGAYPAAQHGYMTRTDDPLEVFECLESKHCPGGPPGTCATLRDPTEVACGVCEGDAYEADEGCKACGGVDIVPILLAMLIGIFAISFLTYVVNKNLLMQTSSTMMCVVLLGMMFTGLQTMGVFRQLEVEWFEPMDSLFEVVTLLSFDFKVLKVACVLGNNGVRGYLIRQLVAPATLPFIFAILGIRKRFDPKTNVIAQCVNTVGSVFNVFFISIVLSALMPLVCYDHPGDSGRSVISNPAILCNFEGEHMQLTIVGFGALLMVPIPFVTIVLYGICMYSSRMKGSFNHEFLQTFRFLFFRFTPNAYWFGAAIVTRSLLTCILPVVVHAAGLQVILMAALLSFFTILQQQVLPWRSPLANLIDGILNILMVLLLLCAALLSDLQASQTAIKTAGSCTFGLIATMAVVGLAMGIYRKLCPGRMYHSFICHHKADAGAQARYLKMLLVAKIRKPVFIDSDDLTELDKLFDIVKSQVGRLVVYLTRDTLTRPWCAGEITTVFASRGRVSVSIVKTPSFAPPSEVELQQLNSYLDMSSCNLVEQGLPLEVVESAFRWLCGKDMPCIQVPWEKSGTEKFHEIVDMLSGDKQHRQSSQKPQHALQLAAQTGAVVLSVEQNNDEAAAASGILIKKIEEQVYGFVDAGIVNLVNYEETLAAERELLQVSRTAVILLSRGTLTDMRQVAHIITVMTQDNMASPSRPSVVPVNLRDFKFPNDAFYSQGIGQLFEDATEAAYRVKAFFKLISLPFSTNDSDSVLDTQAHAIERRIPRKFNVGGFSGNNAARPSQQELRPSTTMGALDSSLLEAQAPGKRISSGPTSPRLMEIGTQTDSVDVVTLEDISDLARLKVMQAMQLNESIRFQMNV